MPCTVIIIIHFNRNQESLEGGRSADLEADFVSPVKKANPKSSILFAPPVVEVRLRSSQQKDSSNPMETGNQNSGSPPHDQLNETRLSDVSILFETQHVYMYIQYNIHNYV